MTERARPFVITRRRFIQGTAATLLLAGCGGGSGDGDGGTSAGGGGAPAEVFTQPSAKLTGELKILVWSHFVPRHDK